MLVQTQVPLLGFLLFIFISSGTAPWLYYLPLKWLLSFSFLKKRLAANMFQAQPGYSHIARVDSKRRREEKAPQWVCPHTTPHGWRGGILTLWGKQKTMKKS
ncbi:hypothetical protein BX070DRAFT_220685 [Coemansia spiralis]|nr:hypothetical protein BX070DRAFT_220685 [Coemansia spiralis]